MFLHAENDGFRIDANHDQPIDEDDLQGLVEAFQGHEANWAHRQGRDPNADWTENRWFAEEQPCRPVGVRPETPQAAKRG